jgi:hypothetical protein
MRLRVAVVLALAVGVCASAGLPAQWKKQVSKALVGSSQRSGRFTVSAVHDAAAPAPDECSADVPSAQLSKPFDPATASAPSESLLLVTTVDGHIHSINAKTGAMQVI